MPNAPHRVAPLSYRPSSPELRGEIKEWAQDNKTSFNAQTELLWEALLQGRLQIHPDDFPNPFPEED